MDSIKSVMTIFAERLNDLINDKGWNLKEFSEQIKIPRSSINDWTLAKSTIGIDNLIKIADFFSVSTDYLLGREE